MKTVVLFMYLSQAAVCATSSHSNLYNGDLSESVIKKIQKCEKDIETMELCMRCAKVTQSEIVYPMCCDNEEKVKDWCRQYIYYGATPNPDCVK